MSEHDVRLLLSKAGWRPNRVVDISHEISALRGIGCDPWPELTSFLSEFSGLEVRDESFVPAMVIWISAERAVRQTDIAWLATYAERVDMRIAPIGGYSHMTLFLAADGRILGGFDDEFGVLGGSLIECADVLFTSHEFICRL